jgi:GT2 family glycosyltransferase
MQKTYIVIPNWNGAGRLKACLDSLRLQSHKHQVVVVDNGSTDDSVSTVENHYPEVMLIRHAKNQGFAGGVNAGIKYATEQGANYVALINNDAVADKNWLKELINFLDSYPQAAIVTSKICAQGSSSLDSTGEYYTTWGLPFSRGRGETELDKYDSKTWVFGASGGASLYRVQALKEIGLFDEDFFAYYEDVDLSFRAQLAGWKIGYQPKAIVSHEIGGTSGQIKGFTTYHTLKNLPLLLWKNVPWALVPRIWPRFFVAYSGFVVQAILRGQLVALIKGLIMGTVYWPKKLVQRYQIQKRRKVPISYIKKLIVKDLPPNAHKLRSLRSAWLKMLGKTTI